MVHAAECRGPAPRTQAKVGKSREWVNALERGHRCPLLLLCTEYTPPFCIPGVNILVEPSLPYLQNAHDFELVKQTKKCSERDFLGMATASVLGSPWKIWAGRKAQQLQVDRAKNHSCSKLLMIEPPLYKSLGEDICQKRWSKEKSSLKVRGRRQGRGGKQAVLHELRPAPGVGD